MVRHLTKKGKAAAEIYIQNLAAKRKEILDARLDTAKNVTLPEISDIENDLNSSELDEDGCYRETWAATDNYEADSPLCLNPETEFKEFVNTKILYMYGDASNYKNHTEEILEGTLTNEEKDVLISYCDGKEFFIPEQVGLPSCQFGSWTEDDHPWHEIKWLEESNNKPTVLTSQGKCMTAKELLNNFQNAAGNWKELVMGGI